MPSSIPSTTLRRRIPPRMELELWYFGLWDWNSIESTSSRDLLGPKETVYTPVEEAECFNNPKYHSVRRGILPRKELELWYFGLWVWNSIERMSSCDLLDPNEAVYTPVKEAECLHPSQVPLCVVEFRPERNSNSGTLDSGIGIPLKVRRLATCWTLKRLSTRQSKKQSAFIHPKYHSASWNSAQKGTRTLVLWTLGVEFH